MWSRPYYYIIDAIPSAFLIFLVPSLEWLWDFSNLYIRYLKHSHQGETLRFKHTVSPWWGCKKNPWKLWWMKTDSERSRPIKKAPIFVWKISISNYSSVLKWNLTWLDTVKLVVKSTDVYDWSSSSDDDDDGGQVSCRAAAAAAGKRFSQLFKASRKDQWFLLITRSDDFSFQL